jgi:hypothetical protein
VTATEKIDELIATPNDWRGDVLATGRRLIVAADPEIVEEWKFMGSPVWEFGGSIFLTGNIFKTKVKFGFMHGASLDDPHRIFNGELGGHQRRSYELAEGDEFREAEFQDLVRAAVERKRAK